MRVLVSDQEGVVQLREFVAGLFLCSWGDPMAGKIAAKKRAGSAPKRRVEPKNKESKERIEKLVEEAIQGIEKRLSDQKSPPTIGDYLKVMQLQKEIEEEAPKEIKVTWVEPEKETISESEK